MHLVIDILAAIILLFFLLSGWRKGFMLSLLGVVRVILAYGTAFFAGRYIGAWLGEVAHRPKIVTIPVVAGLTFVIITFVFHVIMTNMRDEHKHKEEKQDYHHPLPSALGGSMINFAVGLFSLVFLFWLGDVFLVGVYGSPIPGADKALFGRFTRRAVYETAYFAGARKGRESQAAAFARIVSNPAMGMEHLKNVVSSDSVQNLFTDRQFAEDVMSGDPQRIEQNASLQQFFNDKATHTELREMGLIPTGGVSKSALCEKLSKFGSNETIQASLENLKAKKLLSTDKITLLIRDPDFDVIVGELLK